MRGLTTPDPGVALAVRIGVVQTRASRRKAATLVRVLGRRDLDPSIAVRTHDVDHPLALP